MFWNNKEEEISALQNVISKLEEEKKSYNSFCTELSIFIQEISKGLHTNSTIPTSEYEILNTLKENIIIAFSNNNTLIDRIAQVLSAYLNGNYSKTIDLQGIGGQLSSIILRLHILGSYMGEVLNTIQKSSNNVAIDVKSLDTNLKKLLDNTKLQFDTIKLEIQKFKSIIASIQDVKQNQHKLEKNYLNIEQTLQEHTQSQTLSLEALQSNTLEMNTYHTMLNSIEENINKVNIIGLNATIENSSQKYDVQNMAIFLRDIRKFISNSKDELTILNTSMQNIKENNQKIIHDLKTNLIKYDQIKEELKKQKDLFSQHSSLTESQNKNIDDINTFIETIEATIETNETTKTILDQNISKIHQTSKNLQNSTKHIEFKISNNKINDMNIVNDINQIKVNILNFKDTTFRKLQEKTKWNVTNEHQSILGKWIAQQDREEKIFTKSNNWEILKMAHTQLHVKMQNIIIYNANNQMYQLLQEVSELDINIKDIFETLDSIKKESYVN